MKIKIVIPPFEDQLPEPVKDLGVKAGDVVDAERFPNSRYDAMQFWVMHEGKQQLCTVMSKNYKKI